jgi:hypothetical protein
VSGIETNLILLGEGLEELAILTNSRFEPNEVDVNMVSGIDQNVKAGTGKTPTELNSEFVAPTLGGTVLFMADESIRVGRQFRTSVEVLEPFKASTSQQLEDLKQRSDATSQVIVVMMKTTSKLAEDMER